MDSGLIHLRLPKADLAFVDAYADNQISRQIAATIILRRAIEAMRAAPVAERIGPAFSPVAQSHLSLNEPPPRYKTGK